MIWMPKSKNDKNDKSNIFESSIVAPTGIGTYTLCLYITSLSNIGG